MKLGLVFRNLHSVSYETERNFQETEFRMFMKACTVVQETRYRFQEIRHVWRDDGVRKRKKPTQNEEKGWVSCHDVPLHLKILHTFLEKGRKEERSNLLNSFTTSSSNLNFIYILPLKFLVANIICKVDRKFIKLKSRRGNKIIK